MTLKPAPEAIASLLDTMETLRSPDGCPWDAKQTPESLTAYILEEACELIDAIETGETELIKDELGDLLLQVVFQAQIFKERGDFEFADVAATINAKLLRRHPHVFEQSGNLFAETELNRQWEEIKSREKVQDLKSGCLMDHLPGRLPSLQKTQKLVKMAMRQGQTIQSPLNDGQMIQASIFDEETLGWALYDLVEKAFHADLDAETALRKTIQRIVSPLESDIS